MSEEAIDLRVKEDDELSEVDVESITIKKEESSGSSSQPGSPSGPWGGGSPQLQHTPPDQHPASSSRLRQRSLQDSWTDTTHLPVNRNLKVETWMHNDENRLSKQVHELPRQEQIFHRNPEVKIPPGEMTIDGVTVSLEEQELWKQFYGNGTEMIINRAGRRMFPCLVVSVHGLKPTAQYDMSLDVIPADTRRYKFLNNKWIPVGRADPEVANPPFVHSDSPSSGAQWMSHRVSFAKLKITNNRESKEAQTVLHSMHKYVAQITVAERGGATMKFVLDLTSFVAVTAYQNEHITRMKIQSNPFAKAFRDADQTAYIKNAMNAQWCAPTAYVGAPLYHQWAPEVEEPLNKRRRLIGQPLVSPQSSPPGTYLSPAQGSGLIQVSRRIEHPEYLQNRPSQINSIAPLQRSPYSFPPYYIRPQISTPPAMWQHPYFWTNTGHLNGPWVHPANNAVEMQDRHLKINTKLKDRNSPTQE